MPEIAEVETVRKTLKNMIIGKKIINLKIIYPKMINNDYENINQIINKEFIDIKRIGKWLIFELNDFYLLSHLRMEGKYFVKTSTEEIKKHEHVIFNLTDNLDLRYHDTRKFGRMLLIKKADLYKVEAINKQGIEANSPKLNSEYLQLKFAKKNIPVKSVLLDQTIISGLGNIYADEVLFLAKINPLIPAKNISLIGLNNICDSANKVITEAIEMGGTTIKSYTSSLGVTGKYQTKLKVHLKANEPCQICHNQIIKIKIGGRSTYYCPNCQK